MFHTLKPETVVRLAAERAAASAESRAYLIKRMLEKYNAEPDRSYAEDVWGSMLREHYGIDPAQGLTAGSNPYTSQPGPAPSPKLPRGYNPYTGKPGKTPKPASKPSRDPYNPTAKP